MVFYKLLEEIKKNLPTIQVEEESTEKTEETANTETKVETQ